ncbi:MAG: glutamyl-tRNA reductase, partial [Traorella sp.]
MIFSVVGVNFENNSLSVLEKMVFTDTKKMDMYVQLQKIGIEESVILSTCNRSEIYFICQNDEQIETVKNLFLSFFDLHEEVNFTIQKQKEALDYLFEVSNGLHSLVLGEDQIAGQIVKSEEFARINGQSKKIMNHLFRDATSCT